MRTHILQILGLGAVVTVMLAGAMGTQDVTAAPVRVTQHVTCVGDERIATATELVLPPKAFAQDEQTASGVLTFTAADNTCSGQGWSVTVQVGGIQYSGIGHAVAVPAQNVVLGTPGGLGLVTGQPIVQAAGGPHLGVGGTLDQPRRVAYAKVGFGMGEYQFDAPVTISLPPRAVAGTFTALLTVTMSAGPGA